VESESLELVSKRITFLMAKQAHEEAAKHTSAAEKHGKGDTTAHSVGRGA